MANATIQIPEELMEKVREAAAVQQRRPDELVQEAIERYVRQQRREMLYAFGESQAHKLGIKESDVPDLVDQARRDSDRSRER